MSIVYTWEILDCERDVATGGIDKVSWECTATDGQDILQSRGTVTLTPDASDPDFTTFSDVTQEQLVSWVWGEVSQTATESSLSVAMGKVKTPKASGLPWNP